MGDTLVLNGVDSSSTAAGHRIVGESVVQYDFYTLSDIIRPSSILVEESVSSQEGLVNPAFFRQEDGSTASEAYGDNIILESKTGFGINNKLEMESDSSSINIIIEDNLNSGTIPLQNFTNSTLPPITRPSDILISEYGALDLEDESNGSLILNGTDGGDNIVAEVSANVGDVLVLNGVDSSSTAAGHRIVGESVVQYDF